jgi:hypothetical protein
MASARVIAGRMVVSRCTSIDLPAPGGHRSQDVGGRTPAYYFASPMSLRMPIDLLLNLLFKLENQCRSIS